MNTDDDALRRIRSRADALLRQEGLRLLADIKVTAPSARGAIVVADPPAPGNPHGRIRKTVDLPLDWSEGAVTSAIAAFGREALRRTAMEKANADATKRMLFAPGWTRLAHPLTIALMAAMSRPLDRLPAIRSANEPNCYPPINGSYTTAEKFDLLSCELVTNLGGSTVTLDSKPGQTLLEIDGPIPETLLLAAMSRPLCDLVTLPQVHRFGTTPLVAAHARAVDAAVSGLRIEYSDASSGNHTTIEIKPTTWLPFGPPPDEETAALLALNALTQ